MLAWLKANPQHKHGRHRTMPVSLASMWTRGTRKFGDCQRGFGRPGLRRYGRCFDCCVRLSPFAVAISGNSSRELMPPRVGW